MLATGSLVGFLFGSALTASLAARSPEYRGRTAVQWIRALQSADAAVRERATYALTRFESLPAAACRPLGQRLSDEHFVQQEAITTLVHWMRDGRCLNEVLDALVHARTPAARSAAATVLRGAGSEARAGVPMLIVALHDTAVDVRAMSAAALGEVGDTAAGTRRALGQSASGDEAPAVRGNAIEALARLDTPAVEMRALVAAAIHDTSADVRAIAVNALASASGPRWEASIRVLADDPVVAVRTAVARLVGRSPGIATGDSILESLARDTSVAVRDAAVQAQQVRAIYRRVMPAMGIGGLLRGGGTRRKR